MVVPETNSRVEKYVTLSIFQANVSNWKHESLVDIRFGLSKKRSSDPNEIVKDIFFKEIVKYLAWLAAILVHVWRHSTQQ